MKLLPALESRLAAKMRPADGREARRGCAGKPGQSFGKADGSWRRARDGREMIGYAHHHPNERFSLRSTSERARTLWRVAGGAGAGKMGRRRLPPVEVDLALVQFLQANRFGDERCSEKKYQLIQV